MGHVMRLPNNSAGDLRWFWNEAPGELGISAQNIEAGNSGGALDSENTRQAEAAERYREIAIVLDRIGNAHTRILQRYHQERLWSGLSSFGILAGIVLVTETAKETFRKETLVERVLHSEFVAWLAALSARTLPGRSHVSRDDRALKLAIQREAETRLARASSAYECAKILREKERKAEAKARSALIARETNAHYARKAAGLPFHQGDEA